MKFTFAHQIQGCVYKSHDIKVKPLAILFDAILIHIFS